MVAMIQNSIRKTKRNFDCDYLNLALQIFDFNASFDLPPEKKKKYLAPPVQLLEPLKVANFHPVFRDSERR